jgi:ABC-type protease/lipase transport system, ATPase and permease components
VDHVKRKSFLQDRREQLRPVIFYAGVISFFINLLVLPLSLYSLQVFDRVMSTGSMATLTWLTVIMLVIFAVAGVLQTLRSTVMTRAADWLHTSITQAAVPISLMHIATNQGSKNIQSLRDAAALRQFLGGKPSPH